MDELINKVAERAGIDPSQAQKAIEAVFEQLQERLPEPLAGHVKGLLDGSGGDLSGLLKDLPGGLGGMLGR